MTSGTAGVIILIAMLVCSEVAPIIKKRIVTKRREKRKSEIVTAIGKQ